MSDPLADAAREATRLTETMEEICLFLDTFPLSEHLVVTVDDANALRLSMLGKLADSLATATQKLLRRLDAESCVFSYELAPSLVSLSQRLRPTGFHTVAQQCVAKIASLLLMHLQRQTCFASDAQMELFAGNCGEDLQVAVAPA